MLLAMNMHKLVRSTVSLTHHLFLGEYVVTPWLLPKLCYSTNEEDGEDQLEMFSGHVPTEKLSIQFARSSGPGGQNVNKLNTKAEIRFHLDSADWLPQRVKDKVKLQQKNRLNKDGEFVLTSQVHRTQHQNLSDAVGRLTKILHEASEVHKGPSELTKARIRILKKRYDKKRRTDKKYHSMKKDDRGDL